MKIKQSIYLCISFALLGIACYGVLEHDMIKVVEALKNGCSASWRKDTQEGDIKGICFYRSKGMLYLNII